MWKAGRLYKGIYPVSNRPACGTPEDSCAALGTSVCTGSGGVSSMFKLLVGHIQPCVRSSLTCALLPKSARGPPHPPLQGARDHSGGSLPPHFPLVQVCCCPQNLPTSHSLCSLRHLHSDHPSESSGTRSSCQQFGGSTWSEERT